MPGRLSLLGGLLALLVPGGAAADIDYTTARRHWAYQPLRQQTLPAVKRGDWAANPIDRFVLARLEKEGLSPSPPADRRTLIRRAYFDLIGLPPTFEEVRDFEADPRPDAYERLVERLLSSPHHGERWARHWLDVARYADTKDGVLMYGDDRIRPYAYTYRDYVIRAFNDDTPFDRFVHEQIAADRIEPKVPPWRLAAMGFLTLGRLYDNNVHDVLDDRIDTVTRGFLGLTVSCARCHDHKYDAIPIADYYSLYGVFASSEAPLDLPLTDPARVAPGAAEFEKQAAPERAKIAKFVDSQFALLSEAARQRVGDYLVRAATTAPDPLETAIYFLSLAPDDLRPQMTNRWRKHLAHPDRDRDPVFAPWRALMSLPEGDYAAKAATVIERARSTLNPAVYAGLSAAKLGGKADVARAYGALIRGAYEESKKVKADLPPERRQLAEVVTAPDSPAYFPKAHTWQYMSRGPKDQFGGMLTGLDRLAVKSPHAPPRAMVLNDSPEPVAARVFVRGNPGALGEAVPRQFLRVLAGEQREPFGPGSGRLDLARAITASDLTPRVLVNRVWMHHVGEPLVSTPSDFGARSSPPSHPELLDHLAWTFREGGWSLKQLHRLIVTSATYRQASADRPDCRKADPENRLLWRANRRRLDLEAMRDALLSASGRLDTTMHGRPVDVVKDAANRRRTVYGLVDRQTLPGLFRAFDFASPDQSAERRPYTTVPQQALFAMNSPFMLEQSKSLAGRVSANAETAAAVRELYRHALARMPTADEIDLATRLCGSRPAGLQQLAQVLLMTNEFVFID